MTTAPVPARGRRKFDPTAALTGSFGSVASLVIALGIAAAVVGLSGYPVGATAGAMLEGSLGSTQALASTIQAAVPLTLIALGFTVAFRAREMNIGLEGQAIAGGIAAVAVGVAVPGWVPDAARLTALVAAAAAGALLAGGAVALQITRGVSLVISTFLSNFIMALLLSWLIRGPMQAEGTSMGMSAPLPRDMSWPHLGATPLSQDVWLVLILIVVLVAFERLTRPGLMARVVGSNPDFAVYSGIPVNRYRAGTVIGSGALAGLAGASILLASPQSALVDNFTGEVGYIGIAVALLARGSLVSCFAAGLLIAGLQQGTSYAQIVVGVPGSLGQLIQGTVILVTGALGLWLSSVARRALERRRVFPATTSVEATCEKVPA